MKTSSRLWLASSLAAALVGVAGCSGSSDDDFSGSGGSGGTQAASGPASVPDSAGSTVAAFMAYMMGLDSNDETSEPLLIKDSLAVPTDEAGDGQPLS